MPSEKYFRILNTRLVILIFMKWSACILLVNLDIDILYSRSIIYCIYAKIYEYYYNHVVYVVQGEPAPVSPWDSRSSGVLEHALGGGALWLPPGPY